MSGGEFRRLLPSHLAKPGAFGYISVPTSAGNDYATAGEKSALVRAFRRDGCHHCGEMPRPMHASKALPPSLSATLR